MADFAVKTPDIDVVVSWSSDCLADSVVLYSMVCSLKV